MRTESTVFWFSWLLVPEISRGESWSGRACCPLPQSEKCQHACVTAATRQDLVQSCRQSDELAFFTCLDRQEVRHYTATMWMLCRSKYNHVVPHPLFLSVSGAVPRVSSKHREKPSIKMVTDTWHVITAKECYFWMTILTKLYGCV